MADRQPRIPERMSYSALNRFALRIVDHSSEVERPRMSPPLRASAGFTLTEVLVVLTVIGALAGLGLPTWLYMRTQARVGSARTLVVAVQGAIAAYTMKSWTVVDREPTSVTYGRTLRLDINLWDLNGDRKLDGDPSLDTDTPFPSDIHSSGSPSRTTYRGFYDSVGLSLPSRSGLNAKRQILDPWGTPLGISHGTQYGPARVGIWSYGPDKASNPADASAASNADDVCSWK